VLAARPAGRPAPDRSAAVRIRPLTADDLDDAVELHLEETRWGERFGGAALRPGAAVAARQVYAEALARAEPWVWMAELDGRPVGMVAITPPDRAGWVRPLTSASGPAYVSKMVAVPDLRGAGVGAALIAHAHAVLDRAGVAVTLLHYNAYNPLSVPFWHRSGYRPLWTNWERSPVSRFVAGG
jgi:GNAT superfamily N-acetyltransferase